MRRRTGSARGRLLAVTVTAAAALGLVGACTTPAASPSSAPSAAPSDAMMEHSAAPSDATMEHSPSPS